MLDRTAVELTQTSKGTDLKRFDILMVSTADWDNPFWTNKQHVAAELARRGYRVLYVESSGNRRPTATARDAGRIWRRLTRGFGPPRKVRDNIWVWSPILIPWHDKSWIRVINRGLLGVQRSLAQAQAGFKPNILWTYWPLTPLFYDAGAYDKVIFHSVDDMKTQPGMPRELMAEAEVRLAREASIIFTTAPHLAEVNKQYNPNTHYLPNVADFQHFHRALADDTEIPADLAEIPGPRIGFIGAVSAYKMDLELLRAVADKRPDWSFVLIGDVGEGEPKTDIDHILGAPNIHLLGGRPYATLPAYLKGIDVAILPSALNDYTRSMFPMKFFEYLAAGRPVVATALPALAQHHHVASITDGPEAFEAALAAALAGQGPDLEARLAAAREQTYEIRTGRMLDKIAQIAGKVR